MKKGTAFFVAIGCMSMGIFEYLLLILLGLGGVWAAYDWNRRRVRLSRIKRILAEQFAAPAAPQGAHTDCRPSNRSWKGIFHRALKKGVSAEAERLLRAAYRAASFHKTATRSKNVHVDCYSTCPDERMRKNEHLLTRLEWLAKAGRKGQISEATRVKIAAKIAASLDGIDARDYAEKEGNCGKRFSETATAEAAVVLTDIAGGAPEDRAGTENANQVGKLSLSKATRAAWLSLDEGRERDLRRALEKESVSAAAARLLLSAFQTIAWHYDATRRKNVDVCCYEACPEEPMRRNENLLNRLECLAEAERKGRIDEATYNRIAAQIASALVNMEREKSEKLENSSESAVAEAAAALAEIARKAPEGWAKDENTAKTSIPRRPGEWRMPPIFGRGRVARRDEFEELLRRIESEWGIVFAGENDIREAFKDECDEGNIRFDMDDLVEHVIAAAGKSGKLPPDPPGESLEERYSALLDKARNAILETPGAATRARAIGPETEWKRLAPFCRRRGVYKRLQKACNHWIGSDSEWGGGAFWVFEVLLGAAVMEWLSPLWGLPLSILIALLAAGVAFLLFGEDFSSINDTFFPRRRFRTLGEYVREAAREQYDVRQRERFHDRVQALLPDSMEKCDPNVDDEGMA